jgi:aryl-alcohol dehydrogenase-like predicted oxidoreductase
LLRLRLRTDRIDLFCRHRIDPDVPIEDVANGSSPVADLTRSHKAGMT